MKGVIQIWQFLWAWYNLPFSISILFFLGLSALQFLGLGGEQDVEQDADVGLDADLDLDADIDLDADVDLDMDADLDVDADVDLDADADLDGDLDLDASDGISAWANVLSFIGLGKAPLTLVLLLLFMTFGFVGWLLNSIVLSFVTAYPGVALAGIVPASLLVSVFLTSRMARLLNRIVPSVSTMSVSRRQLVGNRGKVVSAQVGEKYGRVQVKDRSGATLTVFARIDQGEVPLDRDQEVVIVEYDQAENTYTVVSPDI